ncbi:maleylpyruvate isomerase family mycothiol-dependent enzyme [Modestobacter italicus]|uniref:maleylpyruvate isomerase family mycothiol-dependent enzyme n=1 Tax=Modestobacter italicus (strain DSM 44449 / CECT 9708 / BC 501) TaxID=2732864 RepID=UPI001C9561C2|nr:maleylpyruvate isomerase family mycothiol-dependent enzyme [Modestobacter italicus]
MTSSTATGQLAALAAEQAGFAALAATADLERPVPACTPWTAGDLVRHLVAVHRWAAATARTTADGAVPDDAPFEVAATAAHYPDAAADLRAALAEPSHPCPTLCGPGTAAWWVRRQLHETFVHRLDLAAALGATPDVEPAVAADCVAEVVDTMHPRQVRLGRVPAPAVGVRLTTPSGSWVVGPEPVAEVSGPDLAVAQLLWRRTTPADPRLTVTGDRAAAAALLAQPLTP